MVANFLMWWNLYFVEQWWKWTSGWKYKVHFHWSTGPLPLPSLWKGVAVKNENMLQEIFVGSTWGQMLKLWLYVNVLYSDKG